MTSFPLTIVTVDGVQFDGMAEELVVRTTCGDIGILAGHINCVAPLGMGCAMVVSEGKKRYAACIGGMVSVMGGVVTLVPTTFEWAENIDYDRAVIAERNAKHMIENKDSSSMEVELAQARLKRALVRKGVAKL